MVDELLDVVDENDNVVGSDTKKNIYASGRLWRGVHMFVINKNGEVLVQKRNMTKKIFPGCYDFSASGHVGSGETYEHAILRELEEELGIKMDKLVEILYSNPKVRGTSCFAKVYKLEYNGQINFQKSEIDSIHYFSKDKLLGMMNEKPKDFLDDFKLIYKYVYENKLI